MSNIQITFIALSSVLTLILVGMVYSLPSSTRLVLLVSGGPGRPPLSGRSVALSLRNKLRKQKNDFLIFKARRVDTVSTYSMAAEITHEFKYIQADSSLGLRRL